MSRRLPPFAAVRAFEAAARHLSFTRAAEELCLTQSAVSHQVKSLEAFLGTELFQRRPRGVALTAAGRAYLRELTEVLDRLDFSTRRVAASQARAPLRIRGTPAFAARWLVPRMHRFYARHPEIEWQVSTGLPPTDFARGDADVVIHWGAEPVAGARVEPFLESPRAPVAAPGLAETVRARRPADLLKVTLLHDQVQDGWGGWFESAGVAAPAAARGPRFAHCDLVLAAAESGQGVALAYTTLIDRELASGRLVRLFDHETPPAIIYSLAYPEALADDPRIRAFRACIFNEVESGARPALAAVGM